MNDAVDYGEESLFLNLATRSTVGWLSESKNLFS